MNKEESIILILEETTCSGDQMESPFQLFWKGSHFQFLDATRTTGGLEVLWNPNEVIFTDWLVALIIITGIFNPL